MPSRSHLFCEDPNLGPLLLGWVPSMGPLLVLWYIRMCTSVRIHLYAYVFVNGAPLGAPYYGPMVWTVDHR